MSLLERHDNTSSQVRLHVLHSLKRREVQGFVRENVSKGATVHTDAFHSHTGLIADYSNKVTTMPKPTWTAKSTPTAANFWSPLKRAIRGTYVSVEPFHLFRYLDEQWFRFNNRKGTNALRFAIALRGIINKRLTYSALTGWELPQTC